MYVDGHVHSNPTTVEGGTFRVFQGISLKTLENMLKIREKETGISHGVFYGPHQTPLLKEMVHNFEKLSEDSKTYLLARVAPMMEDHKKQVIQVVPWKNVSGLYGYDEFGPLKTQVEVIRHTADIGGFSILDTHDIIHKEGNKNKRDVRSYTNISGAATVEELEMLPDNYKNRVFICSSAMGFTSWRKKAKELSKITGIRLIGGSDSIDPRGKSLFRTYSEVNIDNISEVFENPNEVVEKLHEGSVPFFGEKLRRFIVCGNIEYLIGPGAREVWVEKLLEEWKDSPKHRISLLTRARNFVGLQERLLSKQD